MARGRRARQKASEPVQVEPGSRHDQILLSGLTRDLKTQIKFRDMLQKFEQDVRLSDDELALLLKFYASLITFTDVLGQRHDLTDQHRKLVQLAAARGWTQSLLDMWGKRAAGVLERIC